ncbi:MAG: hypothetical protein L0Y58_13435 [Verrucomicrobia subdivision 3 bacterium]|nr:hypothetical protein [Limisphaerales bacterium]
MKAAELNLILAWIWIALGFLSGALLGLRFDDEKWRGGYASWVRRLYRLGHISFFGLGVLNLMFFFTAPELGRSTPLFRAASLGFFIGALTMPPCCFIAAHRPAWKPLFALPVTSLVTGAFITVWLLII